MSKSLTSSERAARLARYYDLDFLDVTYDAELYQTLAHETGGPILELGVGTGRLAVPLALAGHEVVGVDQDPAMLARAREWWEASREELPSERLTLEEGDFSSYRSKQRFGLSLLAVNTFLLAGDDEARLAILRAMHAHLRPGGAAVIEVGTPDAEELARYDRRLHHEWLRHDPQAGEEVSKTISAYHDPEAETLELTQIYEWTPVHGGPLSRVTQVDLLHPLSAAHLAELAREAGFDEIDLRGDHLTTPYGAGSHRVILIGRLV